jgi:CubicO group peptidase (beta-lactamase class C family)
MGKILLIWLAAGCLAWIGLLGVGCKSSNPAAAPALRREKLAEMDAAIRSAIAAGQCPGGVLWVEHGGASYHRAYGCRALVPTIEPMTGDTIFDTASLTKVIATTPAVMLLVERGQVKLDVPVQTYIPEFTGGGKEAITVRQLLTHTSGLRSGIETRSAWHGSATAIKIICGEHLQNPPGSAFHYSDLNFILLGELVQRRTGKQLQDFVAREIYSPLKMTETGYLPPTSKLARIAPTEVVDGRMLRGIVNDPTARQMGGVAGNAGVFTTAADLARFARMMLNQGELNGVRLFKPETVRLMTTVQTPASIEARRGLGWDIDSEYSGPRGDFFSDESYGHTGWTGTSLWIDPVTLTFVIFLSNRDHPDGRGNVVELRHQLGTLAAEAVSAGKSRRGN